jgi:hypothetical protein
MTMARSQLVDVSVTRWYHSITRCVRRAFLLAEGPTENNDTQFDRKEWIELRLQELACSFSVAVGGFSVMDNHLHVLVRLDPDLATAWSDEDVVRGGVSYSHPETNPESPCQFPQAGSSGV